VGLISAVRGFGIFKLQSFACHLSVGGVPYLWLSRASQTAAFMSGHKLLGENTQFCFSLSGELLGVERG